MSIYNNTALPFVQSAALQFISENSQKYAKITAVALLILGAAVATYYIIKHFTAKPHVEPKKPTPLPTPIKQPDPTPNPNPPAVVTPVVVTPVNKQEPSQNPKEEPKPPQTDPKPKTDSEPNADSKLSNPDDENSGKPSTQSDDEAAAWAIALQAVEDADRLDHKRNKPKPPVIPLDPPKPTAKVGQPLPTPQPTPTLQPLPVVSTQPDATVQNASKAEDPASPSTQVVGPPQELTTQRKPKVPYAPFSQQVDKLLDEVSANVFTNRAYSTTKAFSAITKQTKQEILELVNEVIAEYERRNPQLRRIAYGEQVPEYFAKVQGFQTNEERKYLSLAGIRNMLLAGPDIIDEIAKKEFLGGVHHYDSNKGLNSFKFYTGTLVDLETEFDAKNSEDALRRARELIVDFGRKIGLETVKGSLTAEEVARKLPHRKLNLPEPYDTIHHAYDHTDRSNYGIWTRQEPHSAVVHYYANVPVCDVVLSATLRLPYLIAELAWRNKEANGGKLSKEFLDDFFARGISDKCFNEKFRELTLFHLDWMSKFDGAETAEETATRYVVEGKYGEALKHKGPVLALKEAFSVAKLRDTFEPYDFEKNGLPSDTWVEQMKPICIDILKKENHWKAALFRKDENSEYFLLDEASLTTFLKEYYKSLI